MRRPISNTDSGRAKRGASGALNPPKKVADDPKSANAGLNALLSLFIQGQQEDNKNDEVRVLQRWSLQTPSGPEGSSGKEMNTGCKGAWAEFTYLSVPE